MLTPKEIITKTLANYVAGDRADQILRALEDAKYTIMSDQDRCDLIADSYDAGYYSNSDNL